MDEDDASVTDVVPPSPIATSTQIATVTPIATSTQIATVTGLQVLPQLPQLPGLDIEVDVSPILRTTVSGSRSQAVSPIATTSQRSRSLFGGSQSSLFGNSVSVSRVSRIQDWVVRSPGVRLERAPDTVFRLQRHTVAETEPIDIDEVVSLPGSPNIEIVSLGGDSSVEEIVDSDDGVIAASDDDEEVVIDLVEDGLIVDEYETVHRQNAQGADETPTVIVTNEQPVSTTTDQSTVRDGTDTVTAVSTEGEPNPGPSSVTLPSTSSTTAGAESNPLTSTPAPTIHTIQALGAQRESPAEFRSPKRRRIISPEKSSVKADGDKKVIEEEDDSECCPICFDPWTTSGNHRLASLKCGHLFGQSCIDKWLRGQTPKCPQCNAKAKRQDIRVIFAKSIKAQDTTERDRALMDLEKERESRRKVEMEGAQLRMKYQMAVEETNKIRLELETYKSQIRRAGGHMTAGSSTSHPMDTKTAAVRQARGQFVLDKTIKIFDAGNCRVMAYNHSMSTLVVSQPSSSPLFPGFGVKKISTLDFKTSQYITIHTKAIRDLAFHPEVEDGMLLSCGLDKRVKMTSVLSNAVVQSYETALPAWSCVWNTDDRNYFYAGLQNGLVLEFDIRVTDKPVQEFNTEGSRSPVASLSYMTGNMRTDFRSGGILIGQLDRVSFFETLPNMQHRLHILPLEGSLTSLNVESNTRHILASYRPTAKHPTIRHQLCELTNRNISNNPTVIDNLCSCNIVHTFHGGRTQTVLSKTLVIPHPGDANRLLICAGDETNNSVHIWDSASGQMTQRLLAGGITVDLLSFNIGSTVYLAALTDKQCKIYKWNK